MCYMLCVKRASCGGGEITQLFKGHKILQLVTRERKRGKERL